MPGDCRTGRAIPETFAAARPVDRTPVTPEAKQDLDAKHEPEAGGAARVATFKLIDLDGDITLPGALGRQEVRLAAWGHNWGGAVAGRGATRETSEAALFGGASSLDTSHARETYPAVNRPGNLQAWSYGLQIDVVTGRRPNAGQTPGRATDASSPQLLRATGFRDRLDPANRGRASRAGGRAALYRAAAIGVNISTPANRLAAENLVTVVPSTASSLQVEQLPIDALHPDPINPRRISEDELAALTRSIEMFGFVDSVLARCADRRVIAGHQRLIAARRAGLTTVPVILLARMLIDLRETADRDLTLSGFAEVDLRDLLTRFDQREKRDRPARFDLDEALAPDAASDGNSFAYREQERLPVVALHHAP